jgi:secreted Zn-dependent insulinase-like peptidase
MEETLWTHNEKLGVIDSLTPAHLDSFTQQLLSQGEVELFVHGNVLESEVRDVAKLVAELGLKPLYASQLPNGRVVQLSSRETYLRQVRGLNPADSNSATLNLYQLGENTVALHAVAELFAHLVREPLYNRLRTSEQLGYLVWSNLVLLKGVLHFRVLLQSSNASADYLGHRVEAFLQWYRSEELPRTLRDDPNFFERNVAAVVAKKREKDKTLTAESTRLWNEITLHRYEFDRVEREVAVLESLDERALMQFIDSFISIRPAEGESRRARLSVQYFGRQHELPEVVSLETEERVRFANIPVPAEQPAGSAAEVAETPATGSAAEEEVVGEPVPPTLAKDAQLLPPVPVDHRPIRIIDDMTGFKKSMPLFPSFQ